MYVKGFVIGVCVCVLTSLATCKLVTVVPVSTAPALGAVTAAI